MKASSFSCLGVPALVLAACAGLAQASPRPPLYHAEAVQDAWHDTVLSSVNENGVAAGSQSGGEARGAVWEDGVLRALGCHRDDSPYSEAYAINDAKQVAGLCYRIGVGDYAVVWDAAGNPTPIRDGAVVPEFASALNNSGQVVGTAGGVGYVWKAGKLKSLGTLGGRISSAEAINDNGWIVGYSTLADGFDPHAFVYRHGRMEDLNWPAAISYANAVNVHGHIVGKAGDSIRAMHAILDDGITVTDLGRHAVAQGINRFDQVVGSMATGDGDNHGFLYTHGRVYDLNTLLDAASDPDWVIEGAQDINDAGVIVGWGYLHGMGQPVVLTPVP
jgi:probable HAF family extracellular repeat protein